MSQEQQAVPEAKTPPKAVVAAPTPPAEPPPPAEPVVQFKRQKKMAEPDFMLNIGGAVYNAWVATAAIGVTEQDCMDPVYWHNVSRKLKPRDRIEVWAVDGSWFAEFRVIFADEREARVQKVHRSDVDANLTANLSQDPEYVPQWISPPVKYGVRRIADNVIVAKGYNTLAEAQQWVLKRRASTR